MNELLNSMGQLREDVYNKMADVSDFVFEEMEKLIARQLEVWKSRNPDHMFSAYVGNGMISFEIDGTNMHHLSHDLARESWVQLFSEEAEKFGDFFNSFDRENIGISQMKEIVR